MLKLGDVFKIFKKNNEFKIVKKGENVSNDWYDVFEQDYNTFHEYEEKKRELARRFNLK